MILLTKMTWIAKTVKNKQLYQGFTLLEIMLALLIVSLTLGTTFSLLAGSKRLAFSASAAMQESLFLRAAVNIGQIEEEPDYPEYPKQFALEIKKEPEDVLEAPERQTQKIQLALEPFVIVDPETGLRLETLRWKKLDITQ